ncbi:MAG: hypothetical protein AB7R89_28620 [Dehalococcoidia bacterium]
MTNSERPVSYADSPPADLAALYQSWRIVELLGETIEQLPPEWLHIMNIARTLLDGDPIPGISVPDDIAALVTRDPEFTYERRKVSITHKHQRAPLEDEPQVRPIESFAEFPRILMNQRMWQFIDSDLFFYKICTHDVLVKEKEMSDESIDEEVEDTFEQLVKVATPPRRKRQRVLVLRDTSSSMNDGNKGTFAKAVALAYLIKAQEEGAEVSDRSYANRVHPRLRATSADGFALIARRILKEGYYGTTNLADALRITMAEIRREEVGYDPHARAKTEILLISDCENPVELPPLPPGVTIHTLHLEGGNEGRMLRDYQYRLAEIQQISTMFVRVDTSALQLPNTVRDAWVVLQETAALQQDLNPNLLLEGAEPDPELRRRAREVEQLSIIYERMGEQSKHFRALKSRLGRGHARVDLKDFAGLRFVWLALVRLGQRLRELVHATGHAPPQHHLMDAGMGHIEFRPKG